MLDREKKIWQFIDFETSSCFVKYFDVCLTSHTLLAGQKKSDSIDGTTDYYINDFGTPIWLHSFLEEKHLLWWFKQVHCKLSLCIIYCDDIGVFVTIHVLICHYIQSRSPSTRLSEAYIHFIETYIYTIVWRSLFYYLPVALPKRVPCWNDPNASHRGWSFHWFVEAEALKMQNLRTLSSRG